MKDTHCKEHFTHASMTTDLYGIKNNIALVLGSLSKDEQKSSPCLVNFLRLMFIQSVLNHIYFPYCIEQRTLHNHSGDSVT